MKVYKMLFQYKITGLYSVSDAKLDSMSTKIITLTGNSISVLCVFTIFVSVLFFHAVTVAAAEKMEKVAETVVKPVDNGTALRNPGMGWVFHHYDNSIDGYGEPLGPGYDGSEFPGLTTVYLRLAWSHLEPEEGEFNWSILDSVIQRYARTGVKFAFRFTVFEGDPNQGTPNWLREAGCAGFMVKPYDVECWEPDYSDPFFLEKLANFLDAAGKRYDSNPNLAFVDVGTLGIWGEGNPIHKKYPISVLKTHIDLHKKAFPTSLLVGGDDWAGTFRNPDDPASRDIPYFQDDPSITKFTFDKGLTIRDDSLNVYPDPKLHYSAYRAEKFWQTLPVILEMGHYGYAKQVGAWGGERYLKAVDDYHASYTSIHANPIEFLKENEKLIEQMNLRIGYRLLPTEVKFPAKIVKEQGITISSVWKNVGAAPCYAGGYPIWTLVDTNKNICAVFADETLNVDQLMPGDTADFAPSIEHCRHFLISPKLSKGEYTLCVSVGDQTGRPILALPLESIADKKKTESDYESNKLMYPLGKIVVE
ncbi:MAG: DUF4832 domain-containing protein [Thermoguttaceae bacterium]